MPMAGKGKIIPIIVSALDTILQDVEKHLNL